jgi:acyl-CoA synthetase (AMP-forming)/AMP-acid ligase II
MALIPDQLRQLAGTRPDEVGFTVAGAGDLTLGGWHTESSRFARGLVDLGVAPGDRVALLLTPTDGLRFVVAYTATHKAGGVAVPVGVRQTPPEIGAILAHCEPSVAVISAELYAALAPELARCASLRAVVLAGEAAAGPEPQQQPSADGPQPQPVAPRTLGWADVLAGDGSDIQVPRDPENLAEILYTSGTTGRPKGVAIRHSNSALFLYVEPAWSGKPWLHASPMSTFAGLTFVYQPMRMGLRTLYEPTFDTGEWLHLVATERPFATFVVPSMIELLLADPRLAETDLSSLQLITTGSAPIAPTTLTRFTELVPQATVHNTYSMTEAGTAYFLLPHGETARRPGSVGKPLPPAQVRVVDDEEQGKPHGEVGNILVKPAGRLREYYRDPEASARMFGADGWLRTGDLGRLDEDGYLYVVGRTKDVIIRGGNNVHAADVEAVLYEHPAVREAAVVGVPHPVLGEDIAAYVVLGAPAGDDQLVAHCRARLADYKVPRSFHLRDELPRTTTGKVLKRELDSREG